MTDRPDRIEEPDAGTRRRLQRLVAEIVEDLGADAVIVSFTRQRRRKTETFALPFGNAHAVRGLAEFVWGHLGPEDDLEEEEVVETEEEDDDDD